MKKTVLYPLIILTLGIGSISKLVGQCPENISFHDQKSIDLFPVNYPGCTHFNSVLVDGGSNSITNLDSLAGLKVIVTNLFIKNTLLQDLRGLENLDSLNKDFIIEENPKLDDLDAISNLKFIGRELEISYNPQLRSLDTFQYLKHIESLTLIGNDNLTDLSGLSGIKSFGEMVWISGNSGLKSLNGLQGIDTVAGSIQIRYCDSLTTLQALSGLHYVGRQIEILGNPLIKDLSGLDNVRGDSLHIIIERNRDLESLMGFPRDEKVKSLEIMYNPALTGFEGLSGLRKVEGDFIFEGNDLFTDLSGLENLEYINGVLQLTNNDSLSSIDQLQNLIPDSLSTIIIVSNPLLTECNTDFICRSLRTLTTLPDVHDNGNGCNSYNEIVKACGIDDCVSQYVFRSQAEINEFPSTLPFCTALQGDLLIEESVPGDIKNLDSLKQLTGIAGSVYIRKNAALKDFSGLLHITTIGKSFQVIQNEGLTTFSGMESLISIGDSLEITGNKSLISLQGLESLSTIGGEFLLIENPEIQSLQSLSQLKSIGSDLYVRANLKLPSLEGMENVLSIMGEISFYDNDSLSSLSGLSAVNRINGDISIYRNNALDSLGFLNSLDSIKFDINIQNNIGLTKLAAFQNVLQLSGELFIVDNLTMRNLSGLQRLKRVAEDFILDGSPLLSGIGELNQLTSVGGSLAIYDCGITSMNGLNNLSSLGGLSINSNDTLSSFDGLDRLEHVGQLDISGKNIENLDALTSLQSIKDLWIGDCPKLQHLPVLDKIDTIDGVLDIAGNDHLKDLAGLDSIQYVNGSLTVALCPSLTSLRGLENLKACGGGLGIARNDSLINLNPLEQLVQLNGSLIIKDNGGLTNIEGIRNLLAEGIHKDFGISSPTSIEITGNKNLSTCAIEPICTVLAERIAEVLIYNNAEGCNSPMQVMVNCAFTNACQAEGLILTSQDQIDNFNTINPGCAFLKGDVLIREEEAGNITNLLGLKGIRTIGGSLTIVENNALEQLTGLDSVKLVGGVIRISDNDHLFSIAALENINPAYINTLSFEKNYFIITGNDNLSNCSIEPLCKLLTTPNVKVDIQGNSDGCNDKQDAIDGCGFPTECYLGTIRDQTTIDEFPVRYPKCTELSGSLFVFRDPDQTPTDPIISLAPLSQLTTLHGGLSVRNITDLMDLTGLENLKDINGPIEMKLNPILESLDGISGINPASVFESATFYDNVSLNDCAVESICKLLEQNEISIGIARNGADCIKAKVKAQCLVSVTDLPEQESIKIYPNPTTGLIQIETIPDMDTENSKIEIYDLSGREIKTFKFENSISIDDLDPGLYILVIHVLNKSQYYSRVFLTD